MNVIKKSLQNGLTVLLVPLDLVPRVSLQLFYNVGSKNEESGKRGIAHFIEHMIFKGTDQLGEGAIDGMVYALSGSCNAFTSYDYTGYTFDMPCQHYKQVFPLMVDCMKNCTFKQDLINSELKAVIQELKMYKDDHISALFRDMMASLFADHPYHHPIIGYKHDIWGMQTNDLKNFYARYYTPANATLVIAGKFDVDECWEAIQESFGKVASEKAFPLQDFYHERELTARETILARDVQQAQCIMMWEIPGLKHGSWYVYDLFVSLLGNGKGSRLYQKLIYEQDLVHDIDAFVYELFDHAVFAVYFRPKDFSEVKKIEESIFEELQLLAKEGFSREEYDRAERRTDMALVSLTEDPHKTAYTVGKLYLATQNEHILLAERELSRKDVEKNIQNLIEEYLRPSCVQRGKIVPAQEEDLSLWHKLQASYDAQDKEVLDNIVRVEEDHALPLPFELKVCKPYPLVFPKYEKYTLQNGLTLYCIPLEKSEKVECHIDFKAKHYYDPVEKSGRLAVLFDVMEEGTETFPGVQFSNALESYGMEFESGPGSLSLGMLPKDVEIGCTFLADYLLHPQLEDTALTRVKDQALSDIREFWDDPESVAKQLIREAVYGKHPYGKNPSGTQESVEALTHADIVDAYHQYITPSQTVMVWAGPLDPQKIYRLVDKMFGSWKGSEIGEALHEPPADLSGRKFLTHEMNRDQAVITYGGISFARPDKEYDAALVFDQIFGGGVLGSMQSRLFKVRERTGMFYTIGGTLLAGTGKHAGMVYIKAITSPDLVEKACKEIENVVLSSVDSLKEEEMQEGQHALANTFSEAYTTPHNCASAVTFMHRYDLTPLYFENRINQLYSYTLEDIKQAAHKVLNLDKFVLLKVGRV